jgi:hypothetical protein
VVVKWSADSSQIPREQQIRDSFNRAQDGNGATPSTMLDMLDLITSQDMWRKLATADGHRFTRFEDFLTAPRPHGAGYADKGELRKVLVLQHKEEREPYRRTATCERMAAMRRRVEGLLNLDIGPGRPVGRPRGSEENLRGTKVKPETDISDYIVARLKRDAPRDPAAADLAAKVISGEVRPNKAARQMGWRKPRIVLSSPERVAESLGKHWGHKELKELQAEIGKKIATLESEQS